MSALGGFARLRGKTALITGASSGIGASTAILFARCSATVVLTARRVDKLAEVKKQCLAAYEESTGKKDEEAALALEADMTNKSDVEGLQGKLEGRKIDILVNNAGMVRGREHVGDIADEDIDIMMQTNVIGLIRLTQIIVREMKNQGSGTIINLGSIAGREAYAGGTPGQQFLAASSVEMLIPQQGMVETEFSVVRFRGDKARADNEYSGLTPLTGDDIAEEIVWCASRPDHVQIAQMLIFPTAQAAAVISYRKPE
ncbi:hypothetical protein NW754_011239 [Fusarium falciforme]|nr:hypothetical protein NW754_011239 [Fusarium falciforme]